MPYARAAASASLCAILFALVGCESPHLRPAPNTTRLPSAQHASRRIKRLHARSAYQPSFTVRAPSYRLRVATTAARTSIR